MVCSFINEINFFIIDKIPSVYLQTSLSISLPFIFSLFLMLFWTIYSFYRKLKMTLIFEKCLITLFITMLYFQSPVINALANIVNCTTIENETYITHYLIEQCTHNLRYQYWIYFLIIPSFIFFAIVLNLIPFLYMAHHKSQLFSQAVLCKIGFLLNGYSRDKFYWLSI